jgi:hypothetical protein
MRSQLHLQREGREDAVGTRKVRILNSAGTTTVPAELDITGYFPKGTFVTITITTNVTGATVYRYPTGVSVTTIQMSGQQLATALAAVIDANANLKGNAFESTVSVRAEVGAATVTLTLPGYTTA